MHHIRFVEIFGRRNKRVLALSLSLSLGLAALAVHATSGNSFQRYGLQTMCEGGGMANVTIIERL